LGVKKQITTTLITKIDNFPLAWKKRTLIELTKVNIYINKTIIPPVNNNTIEYITQDERIFLKIKPR
jgi:Fe-S cluster assembly iron-binding protein IscA